uniref:RGS domain-containing protein n=1 Tax=Capra hircus TaxID=9925 RepID=A0A452EG19_CAPHI
MSSLLFISLLLRDGDATCCVPDCPAGLRKGEKREKTKRTPPQKIGRAVLSYFLQNPSSPGKPKTGKRSKQQAFIKPSPEEAQLWSEAFEELLPGKYGLAAFRAFEKSELYEENTEFWLACEHFKKNQVTPKAVLKKKEAPKEINIAFETKTLTAQNIQEAPCGCFTSAQKRVYSLMGNNSNPQFHQDLCKKPQITKEPQAT